MQTVFGLLAYRPPQASPDAHVLQPAARRLLANAVMAALSTPPGAPKARSLLEAAFMQSRVCLKQLLVEAPAGTPAAFLLDSELLDATFIADEPDAKNGGEATAFEL
jgi:hypothetical protein